LQLDQQNKLRYGIGDVIEDFQKLNPTNSKDEQNDQNEIDIEAS
jgi:hypothetical protein